MTEIPNPTRMKSEHDGPEYCPAGNFNQSPIDALDSITIKARLLNNHFHEDCVICECFWKCFIEGKDQCSPTEILEISRPTR